MASVPEPSPLVRKPMATVSRVSLLEREIRVKLSSAAIEILFQIADVLSEGQRQDEGGYFGSTMVTMDLNRARALVREECDAASARRIADLLARDPRVEERARALAVAGAVSRAGAPLPRLDVDMRVRAAGSRVHIDLDVSAVP